MWTQNIAGYVYMWMCVWVIGKLNPTIRGADSLLRNVVTMCARIHYPGVYVCGYKCIDCYRGLYNNTFAIRMQFTWIVFVVWLMLAKHEIQIIIRLVDHTFFIGNQIIFSCFLLLDQCIFLSGFKHALSQFFFGVSSAGNCHISRFNINFDPSYSFSFIYWHF